jgi:sulfoacetaldehyde acetyltransferase
MSVSEAFVEQLVAEGVTHCFGIVGSAYMDALDLFPPAGIRFVSVCHEQNAGHMADGYSRATNRHGVCAAQNGPGVTNFVTALAAAYWAHSPVVAITPETGTKTLGQGGFQELDQIPLFTRVTRFQTHVNRADRIAELTHQAFTVALAERGPAQINVPRDFFYAGDFEATIRPAQPIRRGPGDAADLARAAELLAGARFPVILAGGGVTMSEGEAELLALAERLSAPVAATYLHNDVFPASHPLAAGPLGYMGSKAAMRLIAQADVVLALGSRLGPFGTLAQYDLEYWPARAQVIQVDTDHRVLGLTREVAVAIHGDARAAAADLLERLRARGASAGASTSDARRAEIARQREAWERELGDLSSGGGTPIPPRRALAELARALPDDAVVTTDIGNVCSTANAYLRFEKPRSFFAAMGFGNCGYAFPTAMGAAVARPERPAIAYVGDGAWGMSLAEVITCVREGIPATAVVFDNRQWGAEKRNQIDYYANRFLGSELVNPSFAKIAEAMGAQGIRVDHPDQVGDALRKATSSGAPTVIEIQLTQELAPPFRRDALAKPVRLLDKYRNYTVR